MSGQSSRTFALVPAAGHSRRMGRPKLSLPLDGRTVVEHVITAFRSAGVADVLLVLAPHTAELAPLAERAGAMTLLLPDATPDMRATVLAGLDHLEHRFRPTDRDAWFLVPADHPTLDPGVVTALLATRARHPEYSVFVPACGGRRGHPALIAWAHVAGVLRVPAGQGLNTYLRQHAAVTLEVPAGEEVLWDLDTPEEYERLARRWRDGSAGETG